VRLAEPFRRLDERVVPLLADALRWCGRLFRQRPWTVISGASMVLVLVVAVAWWAGQGGSPSPALAAARVGVAPGESVAGYALASRAELRNLVTADPNHQVFALVTLTAYLAPERLTPLSRGLAVSAVFVRVPGPPAEARIARIDAFRIPQDVAAGMDQLALRRDGEVVDIGEVIKGLPGRTPSERRLLASYRAQQQRAATESAAYRGRCSCVYALVVRATPGKLTQVAARSEVRTVDVAPEVRRLDRAVFLPPLPEQSGKG